MSAVPVDHAHRVFASAATRKMALPTLVLLLLAPHAVLEPGCLGGSAAALRYDTIRSTNRADFVTGAVCVEANGTDTISTDPQNPPAGQAFYYIVSPENGCASGTACSDAACVQRPARDC